MEKKHGKKREDTFESEFHRFERKEAGSLKDFVGALVIQNKDPNRRPIYRVLPGWTRFVYKDVLRAEGLYGEMVRISIPEEEIVHTGDPLVDSFNIRNLDIPALTAFLTELQQRQEREDKAWELAQLEKRRERRRRYQKRKRARKKAEREAEEQIQAQPDSEKDVVPRRSDETSSQFTDPPRLRS